MDLYPLLDQVDEDGLHKSRLLNVEEKPFKRITKRLLTPNSLVTSPTTFPLTPPPQPSDDGTLAQQEAERQKLLEEWRQFQEDVTLDFAAFESSLARIQFLLASNAKERERYAAEKLRILATAQEVKENTTELRNHLEEAQNTLALRKTYDELAEKITSNRLLRPREDQQANLEKLNSEIAKLEMESAEYAQTWSERREQFGRIVEEGMNLRRLIRDEKEEVERREGMQEGEEGDEGDAISKGRTSAVGTPRPDHDSGATSQAEDSISIAGKSHMEKLKAATPGATPLRQEMSISGDTDDAKEPEDDNMADEGEVSADDTIPHDAEPDHSSKITDELEEGEEIPEQKHDDKMDTT